MRGTWIAAAAMPQAPWLLLLTPALVLISSHLPPIILPSAAALPGPRCRDTCGDVPIPYPFGIGSDCSWPGTGEFTVTCNSTNNRPYIGDLEVGSISLNAGQLHTFTPPDYVPFQCYDSPSTIGSWQSLILALPEPFLVSPKENVFTAVGCSTLAFIDGAPDSSYFTGCISSCLSSGDDVAQDGDACSGFGCCQTSSLPSNLRNINVQWGNDSNGVALNNTDWETIPCSYSFVGEKGTYNFSRADINATGNSNFISRFGEKGVPLVLDWSIINNGSCQTGQNAPACVSKHSECVPRGLGYLCNCSHGYDGNPYLPDGCKDIDECNISKNGPCGFYSTCKNTEGGYICKCNFNRKGDGKSEKGCHQYKLSPYVIAAVAIFAAVVFLCFAVILLQKRNKRKLFNKNGGKLLKTQGITIYSKADLDKFTKKYGKSLGRGQYGEVFEGCIPGAEDQQVAVKRANAMTGVVPGPVPQNERPEEEDNGFINEIIFQFKIRHTNVVQLLGCCLETEVPILVYEFVSNGSLKDVLHGKPCALSLPKRLDIAIGSAEALSHMHSNGDNKHVHGDIKTDNILLDGGDLKPKVSDFGSSKLLSSANYAKYVAADKMYMDQVYLQTGHFTVKSDVYSFGVVLLELITRKKPRYEGTKSLPMEFVRRYKVEGNGRVMYDRDMFTADSADESHVYMECLDRTGALAVRCLNGDPEDRPTMAEVVEELKQAKKLIGRRDAADYMEGRNEA